MSPLTFTLQLASCPDLSYYFSFQQYQFWYSLPFFSRAFLSNGHINKDSSLDPAPQTVNSTQATSVDDSDLLLSNGVNLEAHQINSAQSATDPHTSPSESTAIAIPPSSDPLTLKEVPHPATRLDDGVLEQPSSIVQPPTSDLREATQPVSLEQTAEIKEQKQQQDLDHDPQLANGLASIAPDLTESTLESEQPEHATEPKLSPDQTTLTPSNENKVEATIADKDPVPLPTQDIPHHPSVPVPENTELETPLDPASSPAASTPQVSVTSAVPKTEQTSPDHTVLDSAPPASSPSATMQDVHVAAPPPDPSLSDAKAESHSTDHVMQDAPPSPAKVGREREDDEMEDGPAAKRSRTDGDGSAAPEFKVPELPNINTDVNGASPAGKRTSSSNPMTKPRQKFVLRVVQNIKRTQNAVHFNQPVDPVALKIPTYIDIIKNPMDLRTIEEKLKSNEYSSIDDFITDFNQIVENTRIFNGPEHVVTKCAYNIKTSFDKQMTNLPGPNVVEPAPADKKKKQSISAAPKVVQHRRESRSSLPGPAKSPTAGSPQTFALGPQGIPLIRRDSTVDDGRPKREIHPPAPRDLPYSSQKPRKKKFQWELKFCQHVIDELMKPKYQTIAFPFMQAVDPIAQNIPTYHKIIKNPMDLGTVRSKLTQGQYENAKEFETDIRLIFQNCYKFNGTAHAVSQMAKQLEGIFDNQWRQKGSWIEAHAPGSGRQSPGSDAESDDEEEEDEDEEEEEDDEDAKIQLSKLQQQIAAMSKQVELIQKKKSPPAPGKKSKSAKLDKKANKKASSALSSTKATKASTSKSTKTSKQEYVTYEQKQDISNRINSLSESKMATALKIIRDNMPNLKVKIPPSIKRIYLRISTNLILKYELDIDIEDNIKGVQDDELELDIDELSNEVLHKLLQFVRKHAPRPDDVPAYRPAPPTSTAAPTRKKNKPMSKHEQEAQIKDMQRKLQAFQKPGSDEAAEPCESRPFPIANWRNHVLLHFCQTTNRSNHTKLAETRRTVKRARRSDLRTCSQHRPPKLRRKHPPTALHSRPCRISISPCKLFPDIQRNFEL